LQFKEFLTKFISLYDHLSFMKIKQQKYDIKIIKF